VSALFVLSVVVVSNDSPLCRCSVAFPHLRSTLVFISTDMFVNYKALMTVNISTKWIILFNANSNAFCDCILCPLSPDLSSSHRDYTVYYKRKDNYKIIVGHVTVAMTLYQKILTGLVSIVP